MTDDIAVSGSDRARRQSGDRRRAVIHSLVFGAIVHGRRRGPRRLGDTAVFSVDRYDERLFVVVLGIFLFCCLDAFFTLMLLELGAEEVNPLMAALLEHGVQTFVYTKLAVTGFGLVFLVVHAAFWIAGALRVSHVLYALLGAYVTLFVYQVEMLSRVL